jgi:hypothetical protein
MLLCSGAGRTGERYEVGLAADGTKVPRYWRRGRGMFRWRDRSATSTAPARERRAKVSKPLETTTEFMRARGSR